MTPLSLNLYKYGENTGRQPINKRQLIITNQPVFVIAKEIELNNNLVCASDVIAGLLSSGVISIN